MKITVLGSGTSTGVPMISCNCEVCTSTDPKDKRLRSSIIIEKDGTILLIDTGPDLRQQFLTNKITTIDAVLYTHSHYDHVAGLDDLRPITLYSKQAIPIFSNAETMQGIKQMFAHLFNTPKQIGGGITKINAAVIDEKPFSFNGIEIHPIPIKHGELDILGYRIDDFAYITDASYIAEESFQLLYGVKNLIINALRCNPHSTHFCVDQAIAASKKIGASHTYFTHISHSLKHDKMNANLPTGMEMAYDGMVLDL